MATMIRKQIYIKPYQEKMLKELSLKFHISEAELIREGLTRALTAPLPSCKDTGAWNKIKIFIQELSKKGTVKGCRTWKREDLYDRFKR